MIHLNECTGESGMGDWGVVITMSHVPAEVGCSFAACSCLSVAGVVSIHRPVDQLCRCAARGDD